MQCIHIQWEGEFFFTLGFSNPLFQLFTKSTNQSLACYIIVDYNIMYSCYNKLMFMQQRYTFYFGNLYKNVIQIQLFYNLVQNKIQTTFICTYMHTHTHMCINIHTVIHIYTLSMYGHTHTNT